MGRDKLSCLQQTGGDVFQSTRPYGARLSYVFRNALFVCFNPRARMGRDHHAVVLYRARLVSIHAPVWGATQIIWQPHHNHKFQSTRPYGARQITHLFFTYDIQFQSTRPYGARLNFLEKIRVKTGVSIHAPVWGATSSQCARCHGDPCFNPRARMGRDCN